MSACHVFKTPPSPKKINESSFKCQAALFVEEKQVTLARKVEVSSRTKGPSSQALLLNPLDPFTLMNVWQL